MTDPHCLLSRLALALVLCCSCRSESQPLGLVEAPKGGAPPDALSEAEEFPDAETSFGLPLLAGMRVTRHFADSVYVSGQVPLNEVVDHVRKHVLASVVEVTPERTLFPRVYIKGDVDKRFFRVEIYKTRTGSRIRLSDITPPPSPQGLTEEESWRRAGRNPDGTQIDPNSVY